MPCTLSRAKTLLADQGNDAALVRPAPDARGTAACMRSKTNRNIPIPHDSVPYRQRERIQIMLGKRNDWRRSYQ